MSESASNKELKVFLASRVRYERKKLKLSQEKMAIIAGMSVRTYKRFEHNCSGSIDNFINVLRVFELVGSLKDIFPKSYRTDIRTMSGILEEINKKSSY